VGVAQSAYDGKGDVGPDSTRLSLVTQSGSFTARRVEKPAYQPQQSVTSG